MGTTIIDPVQDRAPLRLEGEEDEDTIVVQMPNVQAQPPKLQEDSGSESPEPERIEPTGEATTEHQSRSGRSIKLPKRYQAR